MTMSENAENRVILVTGGGGGIGAAIAEDLAASGAMVVVAGRTQETLDEVVSKIEAVGGRAWARTFDVRDAEAVQSAVEDVVEKYGRIDGLVNNAAGNFVCRAEELSANGWRAVVDIVLNGTWNCTSAVAREMIARQTPGAILSVIATYAWTGHPGTVHSAAAKAGVLAMTKTLAVEWAQHGIRLNCIAPGPTLTEGAGAALWGTQEEYDHVAASVPLGRFAEPAEIARLAGMLMSDAAAYVTGEVLTADGGQVLGKQVYGPPLGGA
ncbi:SDR family oxidoreductase [Aeromicrobium sp. 636]|uniref:SDR family oxidoreductase n=1 Tax=Aeromicrobium senzhongii TaxID=2663859 RepID=A0A8I0ETH4_9ACTN|nr:MULTISPECIES: SDR family oxidoreductase [Aeromicrobium]MBC9225118.1 SDR family oxidoreductase [Aeromicrobium senzhongii]MCQ3997228.1 SDR family oxidoreductase [Aeromicrobium sp. 636]